MSPKRLGAMAQAETGVEGDGGTDIEETEVFEVKVKLEQTATIPVRAESREAAWDALELPHNRDLQQYFARKNFQGAHYEPEDIFGNANPTEAHIDASGEDPAVVVPNDQINVDRR